MLRNSELRASARASLKGKWGNYALLTLVLIVLIYAVVPVVLLMSPDPQDISPQSQLIQWIWCLAVYPFIYGYYVCFLHRDEQAPAPRIKELFSGYPDFLRIVGTLLLVGLYEVLWTLLLIIPGIIKSFSYAMTPYILKDYPELSYNAAISKSSAMMKGHKMQLFLLSLSFIGWGILTILSFGLGLFLFCPYLYMSYAKFYESVKEEYEQTATPQQ